MSCQPQGKDRDPSPPRARILIIEDDADLANIFRTHLHNAGYDVCWAPDGNVGLEMGLRDDPDLVLLDVGLPAMNGREVCRRLRAVSEIPILYLTSAGSEEDIVAGLYQGADGYVCKPVGLDELAARIEAVLRRHKGCRQRSRALVYDDGVLRVDLEQGTVRKGGQDLSLAPKERQLLCYLVSHAGEVVPHNELLQAVWGANYEQSRSYLPLYVRYLRLKIENDPAKPQYLLTRFGIGYSFRPHMESDTGS